MATFRFWLLQLVSFFLPCNFLQQEVLIRFKFFLFSTYYNIGRIAIIKYENSWNTIIVIIILHCDFTSYSKFNLQYSNYTQFKFSSNLSSSHVILYHTSPKERSKKKERVKQDGCYLYIVNRYFICF